MRFRQFLEAVPFNPTTLDEFADWLRKQDDPDFRSFNLWREPGFNRLDVGVDDASGQLMIVVFDVIADEPGTGAFSAIFPKLEALADEMDLPIQVINVQTDRFKDWFRRRGFRPYGRDGMLRETEEHLPSPLHGSSYSAAERRELSKTLPMFNCTDCGENVSKLNEYGFMLQPELWKRLVASAPADKLCVGCIESRLGRKLNRSDFNWNTPVMMKDRGRSDRLRDRMGR